VNNFLQLAQAAGWRTIFLGPAVSIEKVIKAAKRENADLVRVSYRLTPETGERLLGEFAEAARGAVCLGWHASGCRASPPLRLL
jgi:cobalamin-dependent methionine synthase I